MSYVTYGPEDDPGQLYGNYYSYFDLSDGTRAYTLTGVAGIDVKGGGGARWAQREMYIVLDIPGLSEDGPSDLELIHWAPFFCLNSISNDGVANDAGWAVDDWKPDQPGGASLEEPTNQVGYLVNLAVGDSDGYLLRVGYHISLLGRPV